MADIKSRKPRGFGFVTFDDASCIPQVTRERYHTIRGRAVEVKLAVPRKLMMRSPENPMEMGGNMEMAGLQHELASMQLAQMRQLNPPLNQPIEPWMGGGAQILP